MSQHYSNPKRANDEHALPNVETFRANYAYCSKCQSLVFFDHRTADDGRLVADCQDCHTTNELALTGWFYWFCLPGCLPDSEPFGPYETEELALSDARDDEPEDDNETEDEPEDDEPTEPQEDDITTEDHENFYQDGHKVLKNAGGNFWHYFNGRIWLHLGPFDTCEQAVRAYMDKTQYWPNVWFISDHGNAHLMNVNE